MKRLKKFLLLTFIFTILFANTGMKAKAEGNFSVDIDLSSIEESDADILLWKVDENETINKTGLNNELSNKSIEDISKKYGQPKRQKTENKKVTFTGLEKGTYFIKDSRENMKVSPVLISLPSDIEGSENVLKVILKGNHNEVIVKKIDADSGNPLPGAEFKLLDENKNPVEKYKDETFVTDENGQFTIHDLDYNKYILHEIKAPDGYEIIKEYTEIDVNSNKNIFTIENKKITPKKPKGSYSFVKINDNKEALEGAEFKVMIKKGNRLIDVVQNGKALSVKSGSDGKFRVDNLDLGTYYLVEVKAPKGYIQLSKVVKFDIEANEQEGSIPVKFITNTKKGKGGKIPKTGDVRPIMLIVGGLILFALGSFITKKEKKM